MVKIAIVLCFIVNYVYEEVPLEIIKCAGRRNYRKTTDKTVVEFHTCNRILAFIETPGNARVTFPPCPSCGNVTSAIVRGDFIELNLINKRDSKRIETKNTPKVLTHDKNR